jgi:hypothetical protein
MKVKYMYSSMQAIYIEDKLQAVRTQ